MPKSLKWLFTVGVLLVFGLPTLFSAMYTVPEGHVSIEKRFGEAVSQADPGLNFKVPFVDTYELWEVRERKSAEVLNAATLDQLPFQATVSVNYSVSKSAVFDMFVEYGSPGQFEERILDRILRDASKTALSKFPADKLIANREVAVNQIYEIIDQKFSQARLENFDTFPVNVSSVQIENIDLPQEYLKAVQEEQRAKKNAEAEKHRLDQQNFKAQQQVNTANANAESVQINADAQAYKIRTESEAQADAIRLINQELAKSSEYVNLVLAEQWNGELPTTALSDNVGLFLNR